jgi:SAM-dependent methyltransferase
MKTPSQTEQEKYNWLFENKDYANYKDAIGLPSKLIKEYSIDSNQKCIDLGCGRGTLSKHFIDYTGVDISDYIVQENIKNNKGKYIHCSLDKLETISDSFDVAICSDVMEHIPPELVDGVLKSISNLDCKYFYFSISTRPSKILSRDGDNLHLTVFDKNKWNSIIREYFTITRTSSPIHTVANFKCAKK